jgi:hypothetical protein
MARLIAVVALPWATNVDRCAAPGLIAVVQSELGCLMGFYVVSSRHVRWKSAHMFSTWPA